MAIGPHSLRLIRSLRHPGPVQPDRMRCAICTAHPLQLTLAPDMPVLDAVAQAFAGAGFAAGYMRLGDVAMVRLDYVIPGVAPDATHAAWYGATQSVGPGARIIHAGLHLGQRDGAPWLHCHGLWETPGAGVKMGHLLPLESALAAPAQVTAWGIAGAVLNVAHDMETNFPLFDPRQSSPDTSGAAGKALLLTVRPNGDIGAAVEQACADHGIGNARVHGLGSLVGADYDDGRHVDSYATEVLITDGSLRHGRCTLEIALVGLDGTISHGRLLRGSNPVCVTFELLIVSTASDDPKKQGMTA